MIDIAGVAIIKDNKILLVQEKKPSVYGLWNLPAGHVNKGETPEIAAKREGEEETGFKLELDDKIGTFPLTPEAQMHVYKANILGGEIKFDENELLAVNWFTKEETKQLALRIKFIPNLF